MDRKIFFSDMQEKISQAIENSSAKDIEKNVRAMMSQGCSKLDLITRDEFDIQAQVLAKTHTKLESLEAQVAALEAQMTEPSKGVSLRFFQMLSALSSDDGKLSYIDMSHVKVAYRASCIVARNTC